MSQSLGPWPLGCKCSWFLTSVLNKEFSIYVFKKNTFFFPLFYATFLCGLYNSFKKKKDASENIKKNQPQKLLIIDPIFFFQECHLTQNQPKSQVFFIEISLQWLCSHRHTFICFWFPVLIHTIRPSPSKYKETFMYVF